MVGSIGPGELGLVVIVLVLLFGARRLPDLARSIGLSARELRRGLESGTDESEPVDT